MTEELIARNPAALTRVRGPREASDVNPGRWMRPGNSSNPPSTDSDPLYAAYVLILVLGLRRGEVLGLTWTDVRPTAAELHINWQLQR